MRRDRMGRSETKQGRKERGEGGGRARREIRDRGRNGGKIRKLGTGGKGGGR